MVEEDWGGRGAGGKNEDRRSWFASVKVPSMKGLLDARVRHKQQLRDR